MKTRMTTAMAVWLALTGVCNAGTGAALREGVERLWRLGRRGTAEALEAAGRQSARLTARYGDDGAVALQKLGPRCEGLIEQAGAEGARAARLLARYGERATGLVGNPSRLALAVRHGDAVAEALMEHGGIVEPLIAKLGTAGATATARLTGQNARRLAMLAEEGAVRPELLPVVARWGDQALEFVWTHKGPLAVSATLAAFVADPEPFLNGAATLSGEVVEHVGGPLAAVPGAIVARMNVTLLVLAGLTALGVRRWGRRAGRRGGRRALAIVRRAVRRMLLAFRNRFAGAPHKRA